MKQQIIDKIVLPSNLTISKCILNFNTVPLQNQVRGKTFKKIYKINTLMSEFKVLQCLPQKWGSFYYNKNEMTVVYKPETCCRLLRE